MGINMPAVAQSVRTTCPYCGVGCGVQAAPLGAAAAAVKGDACIPQTSAGLCSKGSALGETLGTDSRLLYPQIAGCARVLGGCNRAHRVGVGAHQGGPRPEAIAFYLSGQLLTEDYYVANKLAKGFIGTPHVDTNSRLCMASSVAGHKSAFGADVVPGCYEDLDEADLIVLVGSNAAWCHPVLYQRMQAARAARGATVVTIDPRRTATSDGSDFHLALAPGSDICLWNGLLVWLHENGAAASDFVSITRKVSRRRWRRPGDDRHRSSASHSRQDFRATTFSASSICGPATPRVVTCFSQGVNQSIEGTDKVNAIINCHLLTGRIGKSRLRAVVVDGPAQRHGRARGRWIGQHARGPHGIFGPRARLRAPLLEGAKSGCRRRAQSGRDVRRH